MWQRRSHTLAPLTKLTYIKVNFQWTEVKQDAFDEIKRIVAQSRSLPVTLYYPIQILMKHLKFIPTLARSD